MSAETLSPLDALKFKPGEGIVTRAIERIDQTQADYFKSVLRWARHPRTGFLKSRDSTSIIARNVLLNALDTIVAESADDEETCAWLAEITTGLNKRRKTAFAIILNGRGANLDTSEHVWDFSPDFYMSLFEEYDWGFVRDFIQLDYDESIERDTRKLEDALEQKRSSKFKHWRERGEELLALGKVSFAGAVVGYVVTDSLTKKLGK